jgi:hypothetical protein
MTWTGDLFMGTESHGPRERLAAYLGKRFPRSDGYSIKRLQGALHCKPKTAENLLNGHWPSAEHLQRIVVLFGRDVIDAVFGPDIDGTLDRLRQEEVRLEQQLLETRARRLAVEGAGSRADERLEATEAGSLVQLHHRDKRPRKTGG